MPEGSGRASPLMIHGSTVVYTSARRGSKPMIFQFFVGAHSTPHKRSEKEGMEGSIATFKPLCVITEAKADDHNAQKP
jgi:hypothetical protein